MARTTADNKRARFMSLPPETRPHFLGHVASREKSKSDTMSRFWTPRVVIGAKARRGGRFRCTAKAASGAVLDRSRLGQTKDDVRAPAIVTMHAHNRYRCCLRKSWNPGSWRNLAKSGSPVIWSAGR